MHDDGVLDNVLILFEVLLIAWLGGVSHREGVVELEQIEKLEHIGVLVNGVTIVLEEGCYKGHTSKQGGEPHAQIVGEKPAKTFTV